MVATNTSLTNAQNDAATGLYGRWTHVAVGSGTTTPTTADTALTTETYREAAFANTQASPDSVQIDLRLDVTENNSNTIAEIGTFDAASSGNMYTHNLTTSIAKDSTKETFHRVKVIYSASDNS